MSKLIQYSIKLELPDQQQKMKVPNLLSITRSWQSQREKNDLAASKVDVVQQVDVYYLGNIRLLSNKIRMLPSMRYETKKLSELYHMKKSFQDHKRSIEKIKNKANDMLIERSKDISVLRSRMHHSFNYTQYVRGQQINKNNLILFRKCTEDRKTSISIRPNQKKLQSSFNIRTTGPRSERKWEKETDNQEVVQIKSPREDYLLRNHRSSPINKMTNYERSKQNLRLAIKIAKPCPAINTKKLEQIHEQAKRHRERIMRYDSVSLKSTKYLDKKLSKDSFRSHRVSSSIQSSIKSPSPKKQEQIPKSPKIVPQNPLYRKLNKTSIFRNKHNDHQYGFSLTEYQP